MLKLILLMLLLLFTYSVVNGFNGYETRLAEIQETDPAPGFLQLGYFKDKGGKYVLAIKLPTSVSKKQVEQYAREQTRKSGQAAILYFFEDSSETITPATSPDGHSPAENNLLYNKEDQGAWRFAFLRKLNGTTRTVDCDKYPKSDLCRA